MHKRIVYNRIDGGVTICCPSDWAITWMGCGGFWNDQARGFVERQIESQIKRRVNSDVARRYAHAMQFGGCTTAEALEIIRDRDCHGTAIELWDIDDVPTDRWFRNAWRRSHNGGPISIDLKLAKPVQFKRIRSTIVRENKRRENDLESFNALIECDLLKIKERILRATDEIELRQIWPSELNR